MKTLSRQIVGVNKWTKFIRESFTAGENTISDYLIVERRPGLMIVPIIKEEDCIYTYLVKQHRYPIGREVWQFPMGTLDEGSDPLIHAQKELMEETGLKADKLRLVGEYYIDPGLSRQKCIVYLAESVVEGGAQSLEESEKGMISKRFSLQEVESLIMEGNSVDGWIYPGMYYLRKFVNNIG